jgi:hypothetical protein
MSDEPLPNSEIILYQTEADVAKISKRRPQKHAD